MEFDDNLKTQKGFIGVNILGLQKDFDQNEKNFERRDKEVCKSRTCFVGLKGHWEKEEKKYITGLFDHD